MTYYSQHGEDRILWDYFQARPTGVCVEVGGFDGVTFSNTLLFEDQGWVTVVVEPIPDFAERIRLRRPGARVFNCAAGPAAGTAQLAVARGAEELSTTTRDAAHRARSQQQGAVIEEMAVPMRTLDSLLDEAGITRVDFITIDVEGAELQVLAGLDLRRWHPRVVILENNYGKRAYRLHEAMLRRGYHWFRRTGCNEWYAPRTETQVITQSRVLRNLLHIAVLRAKMPVRAVLEATGLKALEQRFRRMRKAWFAPAAGEGPRPAGTAGEVSLPLWQPGQKIRSEEQLLLALRGHPVAAVVRTLYQVGAHRFQEKKLFFELFPGLQRVVLFEPLPELFRALQAQEGGDPRVTVLPYAVSDQNGEALFHVASNDAASSSLLPFGRHTKTFPQVRMTRDIRVTTRTIETALAEHELPPPDLLFLDVQGAEGRILAGLSKALRGRVRLIYSEASLEEIYEGAKSLEELKGILAPEFVFVGYCPLNERTPTHGNALWVHETLAGLLHPAKPSPAGKAPAEAGRVRGTWWGRGLRRVLGRAERRSLRKRAIPLNQAFTDWA